MSSTLVAQSELRVNTTTAQDQSAPTIATLADGSWVVAWQSQQPGMTADGRLAWGNDLLAQRYDARGTALGGEQLLVHQGNDQVQGALAATADGGYVLAYASQLDYDGRLRTWDFGVWSSRFDADGHLVDAQGWSNGQAGNQDAPAVAVLADGSTRVAYTTAGSAEVGLPAGLVNGDGATVAGAADAALATLAGGAVASAWTQGGHVFVQAGTANSLDLGVGGHAAITALVDGGFVVAWDDAGRAGLQRFDAAGAATGDRVALGSGSQLAVSALRDGGWVVGWSAFDGDGNGLFAQRFDAWGVADDEARRLNESATGNQDGLALTGLRDGGFAAAWTTAASDGSLDVHARQFNHDIDLAGHEGMAFRLYQAAFDRMPDLPGLAYHAHSLDMGSSLGLVAAHFITSPEFMQRYGALDDTAFVTQLYDNVLHRAPDAGGLAYHVDHLAHGFSRADVLAGFSESPENQALVMGSVQSGVVFAA